MSNNPKEISDKLNAIFVSTDEVLNDWKGEGNLQFSSLMTMLALKLNWTEKQVKQHDPIIRFYVREHPDWYVTRGAHGGIMRTALKKEKDAAKVAKELAKIEFKNLVDLKAAKMLADAAASKSSVPSIDDESSSDDEEINALLDLDNM